MVNSPLIRPYLLGGVAWGGYLRFPWLNDAHPFVHPRGQGGELWSNRGQNRWVKVALVLSTAACSRMVQRLQWRPRWNLGELHYVCGVFFGYTSSQVSKFSVHLYASQFLKSWSSKRLSLKPGDEGKHGQLFLFHRHVRSCKMLASQVSKMRRGSWVSQSFCPKSKQSSPFLKEKGRDTSKIQRGSNCKRISPEESFPSLFQEYFLYLSLASYICFFL